MPDLIPEAAPVIADAKSDAKVLVDAAKVDAKQLVADAESCAEKLLALAAGDVAPILTDAEKGALAIVIDHAPVTLKPILTGFGQTALDRVEGPLNASVDAQVTKGLAFALARLQHFAAFFG